MSDLISRQGVIDLVEELEARRLRGDIDLLYAPMIKGVRAMPSAQPEIIRCKDCRNNHWCNIQEAAMAGDNFFCGAAERRIDE